ncbi:MAG: Hsp20 family protein [Bacillota bacterium]
MMFGLTPFNRNVIRRTNEQNPLSDWIDDFFSDDFFSMRSLRHDTFKVDVKEESNAYLIEADMPGVKKEEVHLEYHDGYLSILIEKKETKEEENKNYIHRERKVCSMHRTLNLGDLDSDQIEASLKDGILSVKAPKATQVETKKRIEIK